MTKSLFNRVIAVATAFALAALPLPALAQNNTMPGTITVTPGTATEGASYTSTLANKAGTITVTPIVVGGNGSYTETITNSVVDSTDVCVASAKATTGKPVVTDVTPGTGSLVIKVFAANGEALTGSLVLKFICFK